MQLQTNKNIANGVIIKIAFLKFLEKAYKIRATTVFLIFAKLIIDHPLLDLT